MSAEVKFEDVKKSRKLPKEVFNDDAKWILIPSKVVLESLCIWPENQNKFVTFMSVFIIINYIILLTLIMRHIIDKDTDLTGAIYGITGFMVAAESVVRRILMMVFAKKVTKILQTVYYDFWPSDINGKGVKAKASVLVMVTTVAYFSTAYIYIFTNLIGLFPEGKLLFKANFPFDELKSPYYEIIYVWQIGLVFNCVAQFKLLRKFLIQNFEKAIKLAETDPDRATTEAYKLILLVYRRHNKLIEICKEIDGMLSIFTLMMYIGNIVTICASTFLLVIAHAEGIRPLIYLCGHLIQTLLYSATGHDVGLQSTALADSVYECGWHLLPYNKDLQKSLILIMQRSQKSLTMTIGGFGILNLTSYMKLLQFCGSVYVVLRKMAEKLEN